MTKNDLVVEGDENVNNGGERENNRESIDRFSIKDRKKKYVEIGQQVYK